MSNFYHHLKSSLYGLFLFLTYLFVQSCAPVFSEMQSAKLVGEGKFEVTPSYSSVSFSEDDESETIQDHLGVQAAYGLTENIDLRARYERITVDLSDQLPSKSVNIMGFGPKFNLWEDRAAFYLPVGFAFGEDLDNTSDTWQIHPTFLYTLTLGKNFEFNPSGKALIPLREGDDILVAFNLGAGISTDLSKWALRPEVGFLYNPQEDGHFTHFSIGLTIYP